jgi:hypothetical protein
MLNFDELEKIAAKTTPCVLSVLAGEPVNTGSQPIRANAGQLESAYYLNLTNTQGSTNTQNGELVGGRIKQGYPANTPNTQDIPSASQHDCYTESLRLARIAIAHAALSDEQKQSRLADIDREPSIAHFWAQLYRDEQKKECEK